MADASYSLEELKRLMAAAAGGAGPISPPTAGPPATAGSQVPPPPFPPRVMTVTLDQARAAAQSPPEAPVSSAVQPDAPEAPVSSAVPPDAPEASALTRLKEVMTPAGPATPLSTAVRGPEDIFPEDVRLELQRARSKKGAGAISAVAHGEPINPDLGKKYAEKAQETGSPLDRLMAQLLLGGLPPELAAQTRREAMEAMGSVDGDSFFRNIGPATRYGVEQIGAFMGLSAMYASKLPQLPGWVASAFQNYAEDYRDAVREMPPSQRQQLSNHLKVLTAPLWETVGTTIAVAPQVKDAVVQEVREHWGTFNPDTGVYEVSPESMWRALNRDPYLSLLDIGAVYSAARLAVNASLKTAEVAAHVGGKLLPDSPLAATLRKAKLEVPPRAPRTLLYRNPETGEPIFSIAVPVKSSENPITRTFQHALDFGGQFAVERNVPGARDVRQFLGTRKLSKDTRNLIDRTTRLTKAEIKIERQNLNAKLGGLSEMVPEDLAAVVEGRAESVFARPLTAVDRVDAALVEELDLGLPEDLLSPAVNQGDNVLNAAQRLRESGKISPEDFDAWLKAPVAEAPKSPPGAPPSVRGTARKPSPGPYTASEVAATLAGSRATLADTSRLTKVYDDLTRERGYHPVYSEVLREDAIRLSINRATFGIDTPKAAMIGAAFGAAGAALDDDEKTTLLHSALYGAVGFGGVRLLTGAAVRSLGEAAQTERGAVGFGAVRQAARDQESLKKVFHDVRDLRPDPKVYPVIDHGSKLRLPRPTFTGSRSSPYEIRGGESVWVVPVHETSDLKGGFQYYQGWSHDSILEAGGWPRYSPGKEVHGVLDKVASGTYDPNELIGGRRAQEIYYDWALNANREDTAVAQGAGKLHLHTDEMGNPQYALQIRDLGPESLSVLDDVAAQVGPGLERSPTQFIVDTLKSGEGAGSSTVWEPRALGTDRGETYAEFRKRLERRAQENAALADDSYNDVTFSLEQGSVRPDKLAAALARPLTRGLRALADRFGGWHAVDGAEMGQQVEAFQTYYRTFAGEFQGELISRGVLTPERAREVAWRPIVSAVKDVERFRGMDEGQIIAVLEKEWPETPTYFRHIFGGDDMGGVRQALGVTSLSREHPGFLKHREGAAGYLKDFSEVMSLHIAERVRYLKTEELLDTLTKRFGYALKEGEHAPPGMTEIYPDGVLAFYRNRIDVFSEAAKKLDDLAFDDALTEAFKEFASASEGAGVKTFGTGVRKRGAWAVPTQVAEEMSRQLPSAPGWISYLVDTVVDPLTDIFKRANLSVAPRWSRNNLLGSLAFDIMAGVRPSNYIQGAWTALAPNSALGKLIPRIVQNAGYVKELRNPASRLRGRRGASPFFGAVTRVEEQVANLGPVRVTRRISDYMYDLNSKLESVFVNALYLDRAKAAARVEVASQTGRRWFQSKEKVEQVLTRYAESSPEEIQGILDGVAEFLPVFQDMSPIEQRVMTRIIPFYSWLRHVSTLSYRMVKDHPLRTRALVWASQLSDEHIKEMYRQNVPGMDLYLSTHDNALPERFVGLIPSGEVDPSGEMVFINTRSLNPLSLIGGLAQPTQGGEALGALSPWIKLGIEEATGVSLFTGRPFNLSGVVEGSGGQRFELNGRGELVETRRRAPPVTQLFKESFAPYGLLKRLMHPESQYADSTITNPKIIRKPNGEPFQVIPRRRTIENYLGTQLPEVAVDVQRALDSMAASERQALTVLFTRLVTDGKITPEGLVNALNQATLDPRLAKLLEEAALRSQRKEKEKLLPYLK